MQEECEEVGCTRPAKKEWEGKKVCSDHYDYYRNKQEEMYANMRE